jgi:hypothetical protein
MHGFDRGCRARPELDAEFMEVMLAAEDQDELLVSSFEQELEDFLQDVPDMPMHDAMVTYPEARSKLLEKRRSRGFWPIKPGGKDNRGFGKGKGRGKGKRQRDLLLARIAGSTCRLQKGHWEAECPNRDEKLMVAPPWPTLLRRSSLPWSMKSTHRA